VSFPLDRTDHRQLASDWSGDVVVCDIDRTYLNTRFSSLAGLSRIPVEFAVDKRDIAGMAALLRELRRGPHPTSRHTPLYFVSASPPQMRGVIERKMLMDGVEYDGTTFKDWGRVIRSGRWRRLKEQLGFKLTALLTGRTSLPRGAREILIGDDLESDAHAFCLYADVVAGRIELDALPRVLMGLGVSRPDAWSVADIKRLVDDLPDAVRRVYIRLERSDPDRFRDYWPHLVPCRGALQMAVSLWDEGCVSLEGVARVARDLVDRGTGGTELTDHVLDAARRQLVPADRFAEVANALVSVLGQTPRAPAPDAAWAPVPRPTWAPPRS